MFFAHRAKVISPASSAIQITPWQSSPPGFTRHASGLAKAKKKPDGKPTGFFEDWWAVRDSNSRHSRCKRDALTNWANRPLDNKNQSCFLTGMNSNDPVSLPKKMVGVIRLELMTSTMSTWRSNQLSYTPWINFNIIQYTPTPRFFKLSFHFFAIFVRCKSKSTPIREKSAFSLTK